MSFCTAINCMDGRVQIPVINFLKKRFGVQYVDIVSEPGPSFILARQTDGILVESILRRVNLSIGAHHSKGIAIVAHEDCAGNPGRKSKQLVDLRNAADFLSHRYPSMNIIALWINKKWEVEEIDPEDILKQARHEMACDSP